jgi:aldehyde:ferredoxin oxidoreductase
MEFGGYAGNILHVNLTDGSIRKQPLDTELIKNSIGGAGINTRLARDLIPPKTDPLSPRNAVIFGTGPFNGTFIPGASQTMSIYKSPLNGSFPQSNGGGNFSHFLKSSGYDHLVITGRSPWPVYLTIEDDNIRLHHASDIWGTDGFDTTDELRGRHSPCSIIPIGPAGERQSAISVTHIDKGGTIGSGGLAAVMGSKNLKAIVACTGSRSLEVADPGRLQRLVQEILEKVSTYHLRAEMMSGGAMRMTSDWIPPGIVARNSSELIPYPPNIEEIKKQVYEMHLAGRKKIACATCPMSDKDRIDLPGGKTVYDTAVFMEMAAMTSSAALGHVSEGTIAEKYALALKYYDEINRMGLDRVYSFQGLADYVITLYEEGIITTADTGGLELDRSYETLLKLVRLTAMREGFGRILADGVTSAARKIGKGAEEHIQNVVKGQFIAFDPRVTGFLPLHFGMLVHPGRTLGVAAAMGAPSYSPGWPINEMKKQAARGGLSAPDIERLFTDSSFNLGRLARHAEDFFGVFNMLGQCHRLYISRFYSMDTLADLYSAVTGIQVKAADLKQSSGVMWKMWQDLNTSAGFTRAHDAPPDIWFKPLRGPGREYDLYDYFLKRQLTREDIEGYLEEYYSERASQGTSSSAWLNAAPGPE